MLDGSDYRIVDGGGCCEANVSLHLTQLQLTDGRYSTSVINAYANSLLAISKTLRGKVYCDGQMASSDNGVLIESAEMHVYMISEATSVAIKLLKQTTINGTGMKMDSSFNKSLVDATKRRNEVDVVICCGQELSIHSEMKKLKIHSDFTLSITSNPTLDGRIENMQGQQQQQKQLQSRSQIQLKSSQVAEPKLTPIGADIVKPTYQNTRTADRAKKRKNKNCPNCGKSYYDKSTLNRHVKSGVCFK